jgi:hypothetical protein
MEYLSKSYRLDEQVIEAIETAKSGGTSPNRFLRQLLGLDGGSIPEHRLAAESGLPAHVLEAGKFQTPTIDTRPKNAFCKHCGSRFAVQRFDTI